MKKRLSKILWFGDALNENNQAAPPALSPSDEEHLQGLNLGENIYASQMPTQHCSSGLPPTELSTLRLLI